jgi:hypothetical protein
MASQKEQAACWQTRSYVLCWLEFFGAPDDLGIIEGMLLPLHDLLKLRLFAYSIPSGSRSISRRVVQRRGVSHRL